MFHDLVYHLRSRLRSIKNDIWNLPQEPPADFDPVPIPEILKQGLQDELRLTEDEVLLVVCAYAVLLDSTLARQCADLVNLKRPTALTCEALCYIFCTS